MGAPQYEQAGADIGGTGTTNTIPRWTGPSTLGDSVITQSGTLLGVNKAVPTSTIDVDGLQANSSGTSASAPTGTLRLNFAGQPTPGYGASIVFSQQWFAGSPTNYVAVGQITGVKTASGGSFGGGIALWYNNGGNALVEGMRITDTGNVGIGTASPATLLNIRGASPTFAIDDTATGTSAISFRPNAASYAERAAWTVLYGTAESRISAGAAGGSYFQTFYTNGSERARIDSNGNIYGTSGTTGMTNGFFYIPAAAGAPTGTPTAVSGRVPMYYDTTNNEFYVYNGAWKKVALA